MQHEHHSARPHPEFVVLEIGEDLGALVLHTDGEMHGLEIEISPTGEDDNRTHKEVLERRGGGRADFTAVFDGLRAGTYTLWCKDVACVRNVAISGGKVAELRWSDATAATHRSSV